jgi:hypothetical protein
MVAKPFRQIKWSFGGTLIAYLSIASSAVAADAPVLWRDIRAGDKRADIEARFPEKSEIPGKPGKFWTTARFDKTRTELFHVPIAEQCIGKAYILYKKDLVSSIAMDAALCTDLMKVLKENYGVPVRETSLVLARKPRFASQGGVTDSDPIADEMATWNKDGVTITLEGSVIYFKPSKAN